MIATLTEEATETRREPASPRTPKTTVYTLNVGKYEPAITELTYPLIAAWCRKLGAEFHVMTERRWPEWPVVYSKLAIYELEQQVHSERIAYVDSDALIHPDFFNPFEHLPRDTVAHNGKDPASIRWTYDAYFRRDGRNIGSCNWLALGSDWTLDFWHPIEDLTPEEAIARIHPTVGEHNSQAMDPSHLIDDYTLSRNIARYGLKHTTLVDMCARFGMNMGNPYLFHVYAMDAAQKVEKMKATMKTWRVF